MTPRTMEQALGAFLAREDPSDWVVKTDGGDFYEVDVWNAAHEYAGRWRVPREGSPERIGHYVPPDDPASTVFDPASETFGPLMAAIQAGDFEEASRRLVALRYPGRLVVAAYFDASGFSEPEVEALVGHVSVQAEAGDGYPDTAGVDVEVVRHA